MSTEQEWQRWMHQLKPLGRFDLGGSHSRWPPGPSMQAATYL